MTNMILNLNYIFYKTQNIMFSCVYRQLMKLVLLMNNIFSCFYFSPIKFFDKIYYMNNLNINMNLKRDAKYLNCITACSRTARKS